MSASNVSVGRDKELRELVERVVVITEAAISVAYDRGYRSGERDARTPLARRRAQVAEWSR